jgi:WD40 repeat protein
LHQDGNLVKALERFDEPVSSCAWAPDGHSFIIGSFDKDRALSQWDLDGEELLTWTNKHRTEDLVISPDGHWLVAMDDLSRIHVYNFVTQEIEYEMELKSRPTSISITRDSRYLLVNKRDNEAQLIDIVTRDAVQKYTGHTGGDCIIRSDLGGAHESFVISGSEGTQQTHCPP